MKNIHLDESSIYTSIIKRITYDMDYDTIDCSCKSILITEIDRILELLQDKWIGIQEQCIFDEISNMMDYYENMCYAEAMYLCRDIKTSRHQETRTWKKF